MLLKKKKDDDSNILKNADIEKINTAKNSAVVKKKDKKVYIIGGVIASLLFLSILGFAIRGVYINNLKKQSYDRMMNEIVLNFNETPETPTYEVGDKLQYSVGHAKELEKIPDQFKSMIKSYPKDSLITVEYDNLDYVGEKELVFTVTMTDEYGQEVSKEFKRKLNVVDTTKPIVELRASQLEVRNEIDIRQNVIAVIDEVFGVYKESDTLENHTYKLDTSKVDFTKNGTYEVDIIINDNGKFVEYYFNVIINNYVEEVVEQPVVEESVTVEENTESQESDANCEILGGC